MIANLPQHRNHRRALQALLRSAQLVQDEHGLGGQDVRHGLEGIEHQLAHAGRVGGPDQQHQVVLTGDQRAVPDLRDLQHLPADRLPGVLADLEIDVGRDAEAVAFRVDGGGVAGDHALGHQPLDPGVGAGPGDVQLLRERSHRQSAVLAQLGHDCPVGVVQWDRLSDINRLPRLGIRHAARYQAESSRTSRFGAVFWSNGTCTHHTWHMTVVTPSDALLPTATPRYLIDAEGRPNSADTAALPDAEVLEELFRLMSLGRRFDSQATALTKQGRLAVYPSARGQEACQVGVVTAMAERDWLFPTYRDTMALVSRGINPVEALTL